MTTIAPIDAQTAVDLLEAAVLLAGEDHTVTECRYVYTDTPDLEPCCIVGVALSIHGVPLEFMTVAGRNTCIVNGDAWLGIDWLTYPATHVLAAAQAVQDTKHGVEPRNGTWGEALAAARTALDDITGGE